MGRSGSAAVPENMGRTQKAVSRYESQKRRDWNTFGHYLKNHKPPLQLSRCSGAHILEFLRHLDQFGKTRVHTALCPFYGFPHPPAPCPCPLRQAWGSLDALVGRLRAAYEENGGKTEANPFGTRAVRLYLREVRESQAKARGIAYEKKKRKKVPAAATAACDEEEEDEEEMLDPPMHDDTRTFKAAAAAAAAAAGSMLSFPPPQPVSLVQWFR